MNPPAKTGNARTLIAQGLAHHQSGRLDQAERLYRSVLRDLPLHPDALHYLGVVLHQKGKSQDAIEMFANAAGPLAGNPDFLANFGLALKDANCWSRAKEELRRALALAPDHPGALENLGLLLADEGDGTGAADLFRRLVERESTSARAWYLRGDSLAALGRADEGERALREAIRLDPDLVEARFRLATVMSEAGRFDDAEAAIKEILAADPQNLLAAIQISEIRARRGDARGHETWLDKVRAQAPEAAKVFYAAALKFRDAGNLEGEREALRRCNVLDPAHPRAAWEFPRFLPVAYASTDEIGLIRARFEAGLSHLESTVRTDTASAAEAAFRGLVAATNFYLPYQDKNDRDLQSRFGRLATRVMTARFPEFADGVPPPQPEADGRSRIGFFSAHLRKHSIGRLMSGWIDGLDRRQFRIFGYHSGPVADAITSLIAGRCDVFRDLGRELGNASGADEFAARFAGVCRAVAADRLDALIFPDVGMDANAFCVAAMRLAPVQAAGIGHPVTTGLPSMDFFLSGELIEPEEAQAHYSETLVRLPNISIRVFPSGAASGGTRRSRAWWGLGDGAIVFLSLQSVFKYLPHFDRMFPAIALAVPAARFVFVRSLLARWDAPFMTRLSRAFAQEGLERDRYCLFLDRLSPQDFAELHRAGDVYLDTPGWSGGHTTLEAIAAGVPIVTLPGEFMRGRVTYGMLRMIGITETVARDMDDYIAIAVRLGREPEFRARMRTQIEANREKLYNDDACVRGLEDFLIRAVREKGSSL